MRLRILTLFIFAFSSARAAVSPAELKAQVQNALQSERHFDAQTLGLIGSALFSDNIELWGQFTLWRAHSLSQLGDWQEARTILSKAKSKAGLSTSLAKKIEFHEHWIPLKAGDENFFSKWIEKSPTERRHRGQIYLAALKSDSVNLSQLNETGLSPSHQEQIQASLARLQDFDLQSPAFNGTLNAILPGLGHARLGRWQDAALTFALNAISIGATVELAQKNLVMPAVASGTLASLFYVGGITSAWRLTKERNEETRRGHLEKIEGVLFPELSLEF